MDVSEKWGTDVDAAVELALAELKATRDEVKVTVLEQPSRGFFGIGSKLALVRVEKIETPAEEKPAAAEPEKVAVSHNDSKKKKKNVKKDIKEIQKDLKDVEKEIKKEVKSEAKDEEKKSKSLDLDIDESTLSVLESHAALDFLKEVVEQMGLDIDVTAKTDGENVFVYMEGKDSGTIIGKRGQTLDAIQYLTSLVVNKDGGDYVRVVVDAENYRSKREKTLEKLAKRLADKVVKTKRSVKLEPMNPYERKVIHSTLQKDQRVVTRSEGQDPYRRVIIELK